jgi:hypothetical protein
MYQQKYDETTYYGPLDTRRESDDPLGVQRFVLRLISTNGGGVWRLSKASDKVGT